MRGIVVGLLGLGFSLAAAPAGAQSLQDLGRNLLPQFQQQQDPRRDAERRDAYEQGRRDAEEQARAERRRERGDEYGYRRGDSDGRGRDDPRRLNGADAPRYEGPADPDRRYGR